MSASAPGGSDMMEPHALVKLKVDVLLKLQNIVTIGGITTRLNPFAT